MDRLRMMEVVQIVNYFIYRYIILEYKIVLIKYFNDYGINEWEI